MVADCAKSAQSLVGGESFIPLCFQHTGEQLVALKEIGFDSLFSSCVATCAIYCPIHFFSCGIVLCSKDAKFAVECDVCRLPYCLVCLASGGKEPCVRCGQRPSKRIEQLVHLRLKSIYKTFKQSSAEGQMNEPTREQRHNGRQKPAPKCAGGSHLSQPLATYPQEAPLDSITPNAKKTISLDGMKHIGGFSDVLALEKKADAAAEALLAEIEEEKEVARNKKNKKKRRKAQSINESKTAHHKGTMAISEEQKIVMTTDAAVNITECTMLQGHCAEHAFDGDDGINVTSEASEKNHQSDREIEQKLCEFVTKEDIDGIENVLLIMKGVPGLASLRKNAKKALKRIRGAEQAAHDEKKEVLGQKGNSRSNGLVAESSDRSCTRASVAKNCSRVKENVAVDDLINIISVTLNKKPCYTGGGRAKTFALQCECVLSMSSAIVGWVIGKGGQRIRDIMEESGARVWIDQDGEFPQETRVAHVSGPQDCVETAVKLIRDVVARMPFGQSKIAVVKSTVSASRSPASTGKVRKGNDPLCLKGIADVGTSGNSPIRNSEENAVGVVQRVLSCDARFVPLLIGRRGWTIKSIQETSMARVDIDQTKIPRLITITGEKEQVDIAESMVLDVLSYPVSFNDESGNHVSNSSKESELKLVRDDFPLPCSDSDVRHDEGLSPGSLQRNVCLSPPPSSLVMAADANSIVSASSSLSSTPEPSLASGRLSGVDDFHHSHVHHHAPMAYSLSRGSLANLLFPGMESIHSSDSLFLENVANCAREEKPRAKSGSSIFTTTENNTYGVQLDPPKCLIASYASSDNLMANSIARLTDFASTQQEPSPRQQRIDMQQGLSPFYLSDNASVLERLHLSDKLNVSQGLWNLPSEDLFPRVSEPPSPGYEAGFNLGSALSFLRDSNEVLGVAARCTGVNPIASSSHYAAPPLSLKPQNHRSIYGNTIVDSEIVDSMFGPVACAGNESSLLSNFGRLALDEDITSDLAGNSMLHENNEEALVAPCIPDLLRLDIGLHEQTHP